MPKYDVDFGGKTYEVDAPDPRTAWQWAQSYALKNKPKEGVLAAVGKGIEQLASGTRTGTGLFTDANQAALAGIERQKDISNRFAEQTGLDLLKKAYEQQGVFGGIKEVGRQIPLAIAEQLPRMGATVAGARLGAMAGSPFGPAGAVIGGGLGAFAPSLLEMGGTFAERQAREQQARGAPVDVSAGKAFAAAAPAAALDVAAQAIPLGRGMIAKILGVPEQQLIKRSEAQVVKLAEERLRTTLAKGAGTSLLAEVPTEVGQAMIERLQAGLPLTTDDAMKEYAENAYGASLISPLGAAGRYSQRSGAQAQVEEQQRQQRIAEREQAKLVQQEKASTEERAAGMEAAAKFMPIESPMGRPSAQPDMFGAASALQVSPEQVNAARSAMAQAQRDGNFDEVARLQGIVSQGEAQAAARPEGAQTPQDFAAMDQQRRVLVNEMESLQRQREDIGRQNIPAQEKLALLQQNVLRQQQMGNALAEAEKAAKSMGATAQEDLFASEEVVPAGQQAGLFGEPVQTNRPMAAQGDLEAQIARATKQGASLSTVQNALREAQAASTGVSNAQQEQLTLSDEFVRRQQEQDRLFQEAEQRKQQRDQFAAASRSADVVEAALDNPLNLLLPDPEARIKEQLDAARAKAQEDRGASLAEARKREKEERDKAEAYRQQVKENLDRNIVPSDLSSKLGLNLRGVDSDLNDPDAARRLLEKATSRIEQLQAELDKAARSPKDVADENGFLNDYGRALMEKNAQLNMLRDLRMRSEKAVSDARAVDTTVDKIASLLAPAPEQQTSEQAAVSDALNRLASAVEVAGTQQNLSRENLAKYRNPEARPITAGLGVEAAENKIAGLEQEKRELEKSLSTISAVRPRGERTEAEGLKLSPEQRAVAEQRLQSVNDRISVLQEALAQPSLEKFTTAGKKKAEAAQPKAAEEKRAEYEDLRIDAAFQREIRFNNMLRLAWEIRTSDLFRRLPINKTMSAAEAKRRTDINNARRRELKEKADLLKKLGKEYVDELYRELSLQRVREGGKPLPAASKYAVLRPVIRVIDELTTRSVATPSTIYNKGDLKEDRPLSERPLARTGKGDLALQTEMEDPAVRFDDLDSSMQTAVIEGLFNAKGPLGDRIRSLVEAKNKKLPSKFRGATTRDTALDKAFEEYRPYAKQIAVYAEQLQKATIEAETKAMEGVEGVEGKEIKILRLPKKAQAGATTTTGPSVAERIAAANEEYKQRFRRVEPEFELKGQSKAELARMEERRREAEEKEKQEAEAGKEPDIATRDMFSELIPSTKEQLDAERDRVKKETAPLVKENEKFEKEIETLKNEQKGHQDSLDTLNSKQQGDRATLLRAISTEWNFELPSDVKAAQPAPPLSLVRIISLDKALSNLAVEEEATQDYKNKRETILNRIADAESKINELNTKIALNKVLISSENTPYVAQLAYAKQLADANVKAQEALKFSYTTPSTSNVRLEQAPSDSATGPKTVLRPAVVQTKAEKRAETLKRRLQRLIDANSTKLSILTERLEELKVGAKNMDAEFRKSAQEQLVAAKDSLYTRVIKLQSKLAEIKSEFEADRFLLSVASTLRVAHKKQTPLEELKLPKTAIAGYKYKNLLELAQKIEASVKKREAVRVKPLSAANKAKRNKLIQQLNSLPQAEALVNKLRVTVAAFDTRQFHADMQVYFANFAYNRQRLVDLYREVERTTNALVENESKVVQAVKAEFSAAPQETEEQTEKRLSNQQKMLRAKMKAVSSLITDRAVAVDRMSRAIADDFLTLQAALPSRIDAAISSNIVSLDEFNAFQQYVTQGKTRLENFTDGVVQSYEMHKAAIMRPLIKATQGLEALSVAQNDLITKLNAVDVDTRLAERAAKQAAAAKAQLIADLQKLSNNQERSINEANIREQQAIFDAQKIGVPVVRQTIVVNEVILPTDKAVEKGSKEQGAINLDDAYDTLYQRKKVIDRPSVTSSKVSDAATWFQDETPAEKKKRLVEEARERVVLPGTPGKRVSDVDRRVSRMAMQGYESAASTPPALRTATSPEKKEAAARTTKSKALRGSAKAIAAVQNARRDIEERDQAARIDKEGFDVADDIDFSNPAPQIDFRVGEKGGGINLAEAQARADKLKAPEGVKFKYFATKAALPKRILDGIAAQGVDIDTVRGGVLPDGTVFVVGENHTSMADLEKTIVHELVGHVGFEGFVGKNGLDALLDKLPDVRGMAEKLGIPQAGISQTDKRAGDLQLLKEIVAYTEEARVDAGLMQKAGTFIKEMVGALRAALKKMGLVDASKMTTSDLYYLMRQSRANFNAGKPLAARGSDGSISFRLGEGARYASDVPAILTSKDSGLVGERKRGWDRIKANTRGLEFRTQFVDRAAALEEIARRGKLEGLIDDIKALDLTYFIRMHDQRNSFVAESATNGTLRLTKNDKGEVIVESKPGASLKQVSEALNKANVGNAEATNILFTKYLLAERALGKDGVGIDKLNYSKSFDPAELQAALEFGRRNDAFQKARDLYREYNNGLINFAVETGAVSKQAAAGYLKGDYVPYYRVNKDGVVDLFIGGENPIRIGNVKDQPDLKSLVGGEEPVLDFFTSSLQNTAMLTDLSLRNLATRNVAFTLQSLGIAERVGAAAKGSDIIRAKIDGVEQAWRIDTEAKEELFGDIPSELVVKGMEGITTTFPAALKVLGIPSNILRKFVTRDPRYAVRQVVRDSLTGLFISGANYTPVVSALGEMGKIVGGKSAQGSVLQSRGVIGGQVISGMPDDMQKIMQQIAGGGKGWSYAMAKLDSIAMAGDAATRVNMYNSFIRQGLSEREATLATLESMNFSKRGVSPSMYVLNTMIPFFNAQIVGLDVLYKALTGKATLQEKLRVKGKLIKRGMVMAGMTLAYAGMMDDDEAYENATTEQRLSNWFVKLPGIAEPLRVPIPFEIGFAFKALPEALYHMSKDDPKSKQAIAGLSSLAKNSVPGLSSYYLPQAIKPALEVALNKSIFTGQPIVSDKLARMLPEAQFDEKTTGLAKFLGETVGVSPKQVDYLINGYFATLGINLLRLADFAIGGTAVPQPTARVSDYPIIGGLFQPKDAGGILKLAFQEAEANQQAMATFKSLAGTDPAKARAFLTQYTGQIAAASIAGHLRKDIGEINAAEAAVRAAPSMSPEQKRETLDRLRQLELALARRAVDLNKQIESRFAR